MLKNKRELLNQIRELQKEIKEMQKMSSQGPGSKKSSVSPVKSKSILPECVDAATQTEIYMKKMDKALEAVENVSGLKKKLKKRNEEIKVMQQQLKSKSSISLPSSDSDSQDKVEEKMRKSKTKGLKGSAKRKKKDKRAKGSGSSSSSGSGSKSDGSSDSDNDDSKSSDSSDEVDVDKIMNINTQQSPISGVLQSGITTQRRLSVIDPTTGKRVNAEGKELTEEEIKEEEQYIERTKKQEALMKALLYEEKCILEKIEKELENGKTVTQKMIANWRS